MKPNFEEMTNTQLKAYALKHRSDEDIEALRVLFSRRKRDSQKIIFYPPKTKAEELEQFELFRQIIKEKEKNIDSQS